MQVRSATEADLEKLARQGCESFPTGYPYEERINLLRAHPRRKLEEDVLIAEVDGQMVASLSGIPYTVWIGGARLQMLGLAGVTNALEARRKGYASALCVEAIRRARARGFTVSILYPFRYDFYRKLGWGAIGELIEYNFHPRNLPDAPARKFVRRFQADDLTEVAACYQRFVERGNCLAERPAPVWQDWVERIDKGKMIAVVFAREGKITGYVSFNFPAGRDLLNLAINIEELIYEDRSSYLGLLAFLASLRDQVSVMRYWAQPDEGFHYLLSDPRDVKQPMLAGLISRAGQFGFSYMFRLLDVSAALMARANYNNVSGGVNLHIEDRQIAENNDQFIFYLEDGRPRVVFGRNHQLPTIRLSIDLFSQCYAGALAPSRAYFLGLMECDGEESLTWLDNALKLPRPFLLDQF